MAETKNINGYEDYTISSDGIVKNKFGVKVGHMTKQGYMGVCLKGKWFYIHRLVGEHFLENPNNCRYIDHIDRNKLNNNANNLRWVSPSENAMNKIQKTKSNKYTGITWCDIKKSGV